MGLGEWRGVLALGERGRGVKGTRTAGDINTFYCFLTFCCLSAGLVQFLVIRSVQFNLVQFSSVPLTLFPFTLLQPLSIFISHIPTPPTLPP